jgi:tRNA (guanine-N7-)-methyltransferase
MGRRALRKPDPSLDLAPWLLSLERLPRPWDAAALFGRVAQLEVELGSGKGLFLVSASGARPEHDFLGLEVSAKYARHAAGRLAKVGLHNARVVHGDGLRVFHDVLSDMSVAVVHIYFPDPWWKARHKKRRVMRESFLRDVQRVLAPTGMLHFWTDVEEYFHTSLELITASTTLIGPSDEPERPPEHDLDYRTHFERRTRLAGDQVYRAKFQKPS